jgi:hypothetical protein
MVKIWVYPFLVLGAAELALKRKLTSLPPLVPLRSFSAVKLTMPVEIALTGVGNARAQ